MCSATAASCGTALSMLQISRAKRIRASRSMRATISSAEAIVARSVGRIRRRDRMPRRLARQLAKTEFSTVSWAGQQVAIRNLHGSAVCPMDAFLALHQISTERKAETMPTFKAPESHQEFMTEYPRTTADSLGGQ